MNWYSECIINPSLIINHIKEGRKRVCLGNFITQIWRSFLEMCLPTPMQMVPSKRAHPLPEGTKMQQLASDACITVNFFLPQICFLCVHAINHLDFIRKTLCFLTR